MRKFSILAGFCSCLLLVAPAFSQTASATDQKFVDMAAQTDMMEANVGQKAQDQGGTQGVKDFGQMLVTDHTADYSQLTAAAGKAGANVPKGLDAEHNHMIAPFEKLKGKAFDAKFKQEMIAGHTKAIAAYEKEANDGQSPDLKAYASAALPVLHKHLDAAKALGK